MTKKAKKSKAQERCRRCGTKLENGFCWAEECPFNHHFQTCPVGWTEHPDHPNVEGSKSECTCASHGIRAEVHSDDLNVRVPFDARQFFRRAAEVEIIALAECGWGGESAADNVAEFFEKNQTKRLFDYLHIIADDPSKSDYSGFECYVNRDDALAWIQKHCGLALYEKVKELGE